MKINVTHVGSPWRANPQADYLYTIHIEGYGEPQKTFDAELAAEGEHEAEQYQAKASGKTYWRVPKPLGSSVSRSKPLERSVDQTASIQRQVALKAAVEFTGYQVDKHDAKDVVATAKLFNDFLAETEPF